ncbi:MAG: GNAT family N-acetyltransferase [Bacteroidetes bacterium]|nr:GNAT family N-acetyltransferase [Bacteroidota bacterium]
METIAFFDEYSYRLLTWDELRPLFEMHRTKSFSHNMYFNVVGALSESEREASQLLSKNTGNLFRLNVGIYYQNEFVGWHFGGQESNEKYYMRNTALFPEHRGKGVYSALLPHILSIIEKKGFQIIYSRHHATNNAVIVPKLKAGFIITGFEITDQFGTLVHLSYYFNPLRRKAMLFRTGEEVPDEETLGLINF